MKTPQTWLLALVFMLALIPACNVAFPPFAAPPPSVTADAGTQFSHDLVSAHKQDAGLLDRPTVYTLTLTFDPARPALTGNMHVSYHNRESVPLGEVYFRLFANIPDSDGKITVSRVLVDDAAVTAVLESRDTALRVPLSKPLAPGARVDLELDFEVMIPRNSKGHYADFTADDQVVTLPSVYPLIPAYDAKGWHVEVSPSYGDLVYADVSLYDVTLTAPSTFQVIASGSVVDVREGADGKKTWRMIGAPIRDFDINLTDKLQKSSAVVGETTVNSYYQAKDSESGRDALEIAVAALKVFEKRFGTYPYRELDVVETPTTAGGIEYPGLVVIGRELYSNPRQRDFFEFAIVHEVAHQWWYALVGNDQVNYPWVDEALAQYSTLLAAEEKYGPSRGEIILRDYFRSLYERARGAGRDASVNQPVTAFGEDEYAAIVYGKGPLFYDAIRKKMGDDRFFRFLKRYHDTFRYEEAMPEDILKTAESTCACSLQDEYQRWIISPGN